MTRKRVENPLRGHQMKRRRNLFGFGKSVSFSSGALKGAYGAGYRGEHGHRGSELFDKWLKKQKEHEKFASGFVRQLKEEYKRGEEDYFAKKGGAGAGARSSGSGSSGGGKGKGKAVTYKGYRIEPVGDGEWVIPGIDKESRFESLGEAKRFVMSNPKKQTKRTISDYLSEPVNLGGEIMPRGEAYNKLVEIAKSQGASDPRLMADRWMQGYDRTHKNPKRKRRGPVESTVTGITSTGTSVGRYLDSELGRIVGHNPTPTLTQGDARAYVIEMSHNYYSAWVVGADGERHEKEFKGEQAGEAAKAWARLKLWEVAGAGVRGNPTANSRALYDRIQEHLQDPNNVVVVRTNLKQWNYTKKHAGMFKAPSKESEDGVYVQRGKHWDYVFPQYVHFARYKTNPEADSASMYETFHGRPSQETIVLEQDEHYHTHVATLGTCCGFLIDDDTRTFAIGLSGYEWNPRAKGPGKGHGAFEKKDDDAEEVLLTSNEDGTQLFVDGGDQSLDLDGLDITGAEAEHESIVLGQVCLVAYETQKKFDGFETIQYVHEFSEESKGPLPMLRYMRLNGKGARMFLDGGVYKVEKPLTGVSAGIVD
jgi:hypothetical protein